MTTPDADFADAVSRAAEQSPDAGSDPTEWYWLLGHLMGRVLSAALRGDRDEARRHIITSAAVLLSWHRLLSDASGGGHG